MKHPLVLVWLLAAYTCIAQNDSVVCQVIFVGGAGTPGSVTPYESQLRKVISKAEAYVVFLGDNVQPKGLGTHGEEDRHAGEAALKQQVDAAAGAQGIYFIPGDADWKKGHHEGFVHIRNQQAFLDSLRLHNVHFPLRDGCPGPVEIKLSPDLVLAFIDTQWFLHPWDKPEGEKGPCESKNGLDVTVHLDDILDRNHGKRVIVAGHHPVFTNGPHGGHFTFKDHFFPLTGIQKDLYLPLPIVGSLVPVYRDVFGGVQDIAHPLNKELRTGIRQILAQYPGTIYVSGHEESLQFIERDSLEFIVSGSGKSTTHVSKRHARFAAEEIGFSRVVVLKEQRARVEFYGAGGLLYSAELQKIQKPSVIQASFEDNDTLWVTTQASFQYSASPFKRMLLGENYRNEWATPVHLRAFDIGKEKGGLKILQKGGGTETMALRLADHDGTEYTLRSVEKFPSRALPPAFRKTFLESVRQDQVSASHPYGAMVVAPLAAAAGVFHTRPELVYAPLDFRWGTYNRDFVGMIMMLEERPDGNGRKFENFGRPEKMISTHRLLEHLAEDNGIQVDQKQVLKSRLFDLWIGDWDRHDDQWRWGEFHHDKIKSYKPIPRDRDQAFFVNEGFVPNRWRKRYIFPKLEGFDYQVRWVPGMMQPGRWFDRTFLNAMKESDFVETAMALDKSISEGVIDSALHAMPSETYGFHGTEIAAKLKARKKNMVTYARSYYHFLSRVVDVVGSNKAEWIEGYRLPGNQLLIKMYKRDKEGKRGKLIYERQLSDSETKEVRLYGLGGNDHFQFLGANPLFMKIRVIGGDGADQLVNGPSLDSKLYAYDLRNGITLEGGNIHDRTSKDPRVNDYDRTAFEYNKIMPRHTVTYNVDDGLFIGTGFSTITHGFRKKPYASHHLLQGSYAINTSSFTIRYEGRFPQLIGKWDGEIDIDVKSPNYVNNFFGWGNESVFDQNIDQSGTVNVESSIDYYRLRFREFKGEVKFKRKIGQWGYFKAGPVYQRGIVVKPSQDRYIKEYDATLPQTILDVPNDFLGVTYTWGIDRRDRIEAPTRGIVFKQSSRWMKDIDGPGFSSHSGSITLYQSFRLPARVTFVFNAGGAHNTGTYQLYQAVALDGKTEIRGLRKTRFYGDSKAYFNTELRLKIAQLKTYLFPATLGIHAFYDVGRVWYKDATGIDPSAPNGKSTIWHNGFGGGLWLTPFDLTTVVAEVGRSNEGTLFYIRLGFLF